MPLQKAALSSASLQSQSPAVPLRLRPLTHGRLRNLPARRPDAGGPAVIREATTTSFRAEEEQIQCRSEPQRAVASDANDAPATPPPDAPCSAASRDFLRAFILQEALGPPCRADDGIDYHAALAIGTQSLPCVIRCIRFLTYLYGFYSASRETRYSSMSGLQKQGYTAIVSKRSNRK